MAPYRYRRMRHYLAIRAELHAADGPARLVETAVRGTCRNPNASWESMRLPSGIGAFGLFAIWFTQIEVLNDLHEEPDWITVGIF